MTNDRISTIPLKARYLRANLFIVFFKVPNIKYELAHLIIFLIYFATYY